MIKFLPAIVFVDVETKKVEKITNKQTQLEGKFIVSNLVSAIKDGDIKVTEDLYLYQIFANGVEVYPNVNFWDSVVFNPIIICKNNSEKDIKEVNFNDFFVWGFIFFMFLYI